MIQLARRARKRDQTGFTLIELLVVIIVLGILAAVVVFAVQGTGDKGRTAAIEIDDRTIRTAEETFCSQNGRYGTVPELVTAGLLSANSTYNRVFVDTSFGPCGNTSYSIFGPTQQPVLPGISASCTGNAWCAGPVTNFSGTVGPPGPPAPGSRFLSGSGVQLADGRILYNSSPTNNGSGASNGNGPVLPWHLFDPATGSAGSWSPMTSPSSTPATTSPGAVPNYLVNSAGGGSVGTYVKKLVKGPPAWCGANCGKVLVHMRQSELGAHAGAIYSGAPWVLFDPNTSEPGTQSAGRWQDLSTVPAVPSTSGIPGSGGPYRRFYRANAIQLTRTPCANLCGKFLLVGQGLENGNATIDTPPDPEIWDPADGPNGSFRKLGLDRGYAEAAPNSFASGLDENPGLAMLDDGRVLIYSFDSLGSGGNLVQLFDPVTERFTTIPGPQVRLNTNVTNVLSGGSVVISGSGKTVLFRPGASPSPWEEVASCASLCIPTVRLANGKIVGIQGNSANNFLFDPVLKTWTPLPTAFTPTNQAIRVAPGGMIYLTETSPGSCGNLCNRVVSYRTFPNWTGGNPTVVFTP